MQPSLAAVIRRLSELTGNSQSALIADLLEGSLPTLERMCTVLDAAKKLKEQGDAIPQEISQRLEQTQWQLERQLGLLLDDSDDVRRLILEETERVQRRAARPGKRSADRAARPDLAPFSNRGVTPHPTEGSVKPKRVSKGAK